MQTENTGNMYTKLKTTKFSEQNGFYRQKSVCSVTSVGTKHILNSFGETVLKSSEVIFWHIISGFFQHFPEFFFRFRLSFISFSVQVIPYCLYNIWSGLCGGQSMTVSQEAWYNIPEDYERKRRQSPKKSSRYANGGHTKYWLLPLEAILFWKVCVF